MTLMRRLNDTPLFVTLPDEKSTSYLGKLDVPVVDLATWYGEANLRGNDLDLPNLSEITVLRHFTNMSSKNYGVENGTYPLGSCTMKYNPKVNETVATLPGFAKTHPLQPVTTVQGNLKLIYDLEGMLADITGMDRFTFQPAAGAHGELTGLLLIRAYHEARNDTKRHIILVPDSSHGTNPASAMMAGYDVVEIGSNPDGSVNLDALNNVLSDEVAGLMLTNPSTLGLFEQGISQITKAVHDAGGLVYYDGANLNAILMQTRPGDMGFDVVHLNVHKTFSTPHGGGGPGAGPVGCKEFLASYLPCPQVQKNGNKYELLRQSPLSVGQVRSFLGPFAVYVRTYAYILALGASGLREVAEAAVANATYVMKRLQDAYDMPYDAMPMHEFVMTGERQKKQGCATLDLAKRLIDYGFHPPTIYFPMIVHEAMMVEPTETETRADLDALVEAFLALAREVESDKEKLLEAPHDMPIARPDELQAAKKPILKL